MMLLSRVALASSALLAPAVLAQRTDDNQYTVWSSVVLTRTGERTPELLGDAPITLTSTGANQAYAAGSFFRNRYILAQVPENRNNSNGAGNAGAPVNGLNRDLYNNMQTSALALFQQWNVATAQAFLQGLYPPFEIGGNSTAEARLDLSSLLANGTAVNAPLGGYQYPQIRTAGPNDPAYIYLSGNLACPAHQHAADMYNRTAEFNETYTDSKGIYTALGSKLLQDVLPVSSWGYDQAYAIYDYLRYQNAHSNASAEALADSIDVTTNVTFLNELRWLADKQLNAQLTNETAINSVTMRSGLPGGVQGSISTIAGNMWAAQVLISLSNSITTQRNAPKLSLFFADYHPFMSFFKLANLPDTNRYFYGMPNFGASMVFELFSYTNGSEPSFPQNPDELFVRFLYRNGSEAGDTLQSYPIFANGPSSTDMPWREFRNDMMSILMRSIGDWCTLCDSDAIFCTAYDQEEMNDAVRAWLRSHGNSGRNGGLSPVLSGVIGAIVALFVAGIIFALVMLLGGIRFRRTQSQGRSDLGGFKGGQKMRSDQDLTLPKGGAVVGASVEDSAMSPGHERVGSWELKQSEAGRLGLPGGNSLRPSMEEARDPFADPHSIKPTMPHERV